MTLTDISLDPLRSQLAILYCPTGQGNPYDPCCMLRSLLLMTLVRESSPDRWARRLRKERVLAILAGFVPGYTPCATAHRDFMTRFIDGPYEIRKKQDQTLSQTLKGRHERHLNDMTKKRKADADREHTTQSEILCRQLLEHADDPRDPNALQTRRDDLFVELGLKPSLKASIPGDTRKVTVSGDGTPIATAASPDGKKTCNCPLNSKDCDHPRLLTSKTAQWCFHVHRGWVFGDEFYTISLSSNGHDIPLITIMGRGNESDFTLSLKAIDELLNMIREHDLPIDIAVFTGDGHHDTQALSRYLKAKGILSVIPLKGRDDDTQHTQEQTPEQQQQQELRDSKRFKELFAQRTGVERSHSTEDSYHVDHRCRNAVYALLKLTLVNCAKHARLRWLEFQKTQSTAALFDEVRRRIVSAPDEVTVLE